jgi:F-type H+-transporting ATPase subunit a
MDIHISLAAEELFKIGPIPVTNSMMTMFLVMALVLTAGIFIARRAQNVPTGRTQGLAEMLVGFLVDLVEGTGGKRLGRRILPLISGIFIFILFANFSGLLPGVGTIGLKHGDSLTPLFRPPTADLNMTFALSILAFTAIQIAGISAHGVVGRIKHMADPPFLFPIEVIGELSRILSLAARLFGNVLAGEILLGVMYAMGAAIKVAVLPALFPVVFLGLEVLFGTIQALVFALLTLIYIMLAAAHSHADEHEPAATHARAEDGVSGSLPSPQPSGN